MKAFASRALPLVTLITAFAFSEVPVDTFTYVNAFTSATLYKSLHVYFSKVYKDRAEINWTEEWECDTKVRAYKIRWGKAEGVYTDSINLYPYKELIVNTTTLENLEPGTKYYADFHRDYTGRVYNRDFVFTTPPLDPIPPVPVTDTGYIDPTSAGSSKPASRITQLSKINSISSVEITTINGQRISRFPYTSFRNTETAIANSKLVPGLYIASFKSRENITLSTSRFMIN